MSEYTMKLSQDLQPGDIVVEPKSKMECKLVEVKVAVAEFEQDPPWFRVMSAEWGNITYHTHVRVLYDGEPYGMYNYIKYNYPVTVKI